MVNLPCESLGGPAFSIENTLTIYMGFLFFLAQVRKLGPTYGTTLTCKGGENPYMREVGRDQRLITGNSGEGRSH